MKLLISGYGENGRANIVKCDENGRVFWSDDIESPSFFTVCGDRMFAVTENDDYACFHSYVAEGDGYRRVDSIRFDGTDLCHICYSPKHGMVFGACWGSGHLVYASVDANGKFVKADSLLQVKEVDDPEIRTRAHFCLLDRAEDTLLVTNVGLDIIYFYKIENGALSETDRIYTEKGQHPRHAVYNHDESLLYVITELSNEILTYKMPEKKLIGRISTLPDGFVGKSNCSAICLSPDEKTVYGANRYSESLAFFKTNPDGTLHKVLQLPTDGVKPRHMVLSPDGKTLIVCYQVSGEICIMPLAADGLPESGKAHKFPFADAACAYVFDENQQDWE